MQLGWQVIVAKSQPNSNAWHCMDILTRLHQTEELRVIKWNEFRLRLLQWKPKLIRGAYIFFSVSLSLPSSSLPLLSSNDNDHCDEMLYKPHTQPRITSLQFGDKRDWILRPENREGKARAHTLTHSIHSFVGVIVESTLSKVVSVCVCVCAMKLRHTSLCVHRA